MFSMTSKRLIAQLLMLQMAFNPLLSAWAARNPQQEYNQWEREFYDLKRLRGGHAVGPRQLQLSHEQQQRLLQQAREAMARAKANGVEFDGIEIDAMADDQYQATLTRSANGTIVVDITQASRAGVSHNKFWQFNVTEQGLILNNGEQAHVSQLGGWVKGNQRLVGGSADVIVAEVTRAGLSRLQGMTEVSGAGAEFILANPNGITCDGCGFINVPQLTLVTGAVKRDGDSIAGYHMGNGQVQVEGEGMNVSNVSRADILSRAIAINADLFAQNLNLQTGNGFYDARRGQMQSTESDDELAVSLDVAALGGMYAERIRLVGTEAGVGVRSEGLIQARELTLSADGQLQLNNVLANNARLRSANAGIELSGELQAEQVALQAHSTIEQQGTLIARQRLQAESAALTQSGQLYVGLNDAGELAAGELQLNSQQLSNSGVIASLGQVDINAAQLTNQAGAELNLGELNLNAERLDNQGLLLTQGNALMNAAELHNDQGVINVLGEQAHINAALLSNVDGQLAQLNGAGQLHINSTTLDNTRGQIASQQQLHIDNQASLNNQAGQLYSGNTLSINSGELNNSGAATVLAQHARINSQRVVQDEHAVLQAEQLQLQTQQLANGGTIAATQLHIDAEQLANDGSLLASDSVTIAASDIANRGDINAGQRLRIDSERLVNRGLLYASAQQLQVSRLDNQADGLLAAEQLVIDATTLSNAADINASEQVTLNAEQFNNHGNVVAERASIAATELSNSAGAVLSAEQLALQTSELNNAGQVQAATLQLRAERLDNAGVIYHRGSESDSLHLDSDYWLNRQDATFASDAESMQLHGQLDNAGVIAHNGEGMLDFSELTRLINRGTISAAGSATLAAIDNRTDGVVYSAGEMTLTGNSQNAGTLSSDSVLSIADTLSNSGIIASDAMQLDTTTLSNSGVLQASTLTGDVGNWDNQDGTVVADQLQLSADSLDNRAGVVSARELTLQIQGELDNRDGQLVALSNRDEETTPATLATINAASLRNDGGQIASDAERLQLTVSGSIDNGAGQLLQLGDDGLLVIDSAAFSQSEDGQLNSVGDLQLSTQTLSNAGLIGADQSLQLHSDRIDNQGVLVARDGELSVHADSLNNSGTLSGAEALVIELAHTSAAMRAFMSDDSGVLSNSGVLQSNGEVTIDAAAITQAGTIGAERIAITASGAVQVGEDDQLVADSALRIDSDRLDNAGILAASDNLTLTQRELHNDGVVQSEQQLHIDAATVDNQGVLNAGALALNAAHLSNGGQIVGDSALTLNTAELTNLTDGVIATNAEDFSLAGQLDNAGVIAHNGEGMLDFSELTRLINRGTISAAGSATLAAIDNRTDGVVYSAGEMTLTGNSQNAGTLSSDSLLSIADTLSNSGIIASDAMQLDTTTLSNSGVLQASTLTGDVGNWDNQDGTVVADQLQLSADSLDNRAGVVSARELTLQIQGELDNRDGQLVALSNRDEETTPAALTNIVAERLLNDGGQIASDAERMQLTVSGSIDNGAGQLLQLGDDGLLVIDSAAFSQSEDGQLNSVGDLQLSTQTLSNAGLIGADQSLQLHSDRIDNQGVLVARDGELSVHADSLNNSGTLSGAEALVIELAHTSAAMRAFMSDDSGVLSNSGVLQSNGEVTIDAAAITQAGTIGAERIAITASGAVQVQEDDQLVADSELRIDSDRLDNAGILAASDSLTLIQDTLDNRGVVQSEQQLHIDANAVDNQGVLNAGALALNAAHLSNGGQIVGDSALTLNTAELTNLADGVIATNAEDFSLAGQLDNAGVIAHNGEGMLDFSELTSLINHGTISAAGSATLAAIDNRTDGVVYSAGEMTLTGNSQNAGTLSSDSVLSIADTLSNSGIIASDAMQLDTTTLSNSGVLQASTMTGDVGNWDNQDGTVVADQLQLSADSLDNRAGVVSARELTLQVQGELDNRDGQLVALSNRDEETTPAALTNIVAERLLNDGGQIASDAERLQLTVSGSIDNGAGQLLQLGDDGLLVIDSAAFSQNEDGQLNSVGDLQLSTQTLSNAGLIGADQSLQLEIDNIDNQGVLVARAGELSVHAAHLNNSGTLSGAEALNAELSQVLNNSGVLQSNGEVTIDAAAITQAGTIGAERIAITASGAVQVGDDDQLVADSELRIDSDRLNNAGILAASDNLTLIQDTLDNSGVVQSEQQLHIDANAVDNQGVLNAGALALSAEHLTNSGQIVGDSALTLTTAELTNLADGVIVTNADDVSFSGQLTNAGVIAHKGSGVLDMSQLSGLLNSGTLQTSAQARIANLDNRATGIVYSAGDLQLNGGQTLTNGVRNAGQISSDADIRVTAALTNSGVLVSEQALQFSAARDLRNNGQIQAGSLSGSLAKWDNRNGSLVAEQIAIDAQQVDNRAGLLRSEQLQLQVDGLFDNRQGQLFAYASGGGTGNSVLQAGSVANHGGNIASNASRFTIDVAGHLNNNDGDILQLGNGSLVLKADDLSVAAGGQLNSNGSARIELRDQLSNAGLISAAGNLTATAARLSNSDIIASRGGELSLTLTQSLSNSGTVSALQRAELNAANLNNSGLMQSSGWLVVDTRDATRLGTLNADSLSLTIDNGIVVNSHDAITATHSLSLNSGGDITNHGLLSANNNLSLGGRNLVNTNTISAKNVELDFAQTVNNGAAGKLLASNQLDVTSRELNNSGALASAGSLLIDSDKVSNSNLLYGLDAVYVFTNNLTNSGGASLYSGGDLMVAANSSGAKAAQIRNIGSTIAAARDLELSANAILNRREGVSYESQVVDSSGRQALDDWRTSKAITESQYGGEQNFIYTTTETVESTAIASERDSVIASGRDMYLTGGDIVNEYGSIAAGRNLQLSGNDLLNRAAANRTEKNSYEITATMMVHGCANGEMEGNTFYCKMKGRPATTLSSSKELLDSQVTFTGGAFGTITAGGNISGNLAGSLTNGDANVSYGESYNVSHNNSRRNANRGSNGSSSIGGGQAQLTDAGDADVAQGGSYQAHHGDYRDGNGDKQGLGADQQSLADSQQASRDALNNSQQTQQQVSANSGNYRDGNGDKQGLGADQQSLADSQQASRDALNNSQQTQQQVAANDGEYRDAGPFSFGSLIKVVVDTQTSPIHTDPAVNHSDDAATASAQQLAQPGAQIDGPNAQQGSTRTANAEGTWREGEAVNYTRENRGSHQSKNDFYNFSGFLADNGIDYDGQQVEQAQQREALADNANGQPTRYVAGQAAPGSLSALQSILLSDEQVSLLANELGISPDIIASGQASLTASLDNMALLENGDLIAAGGDIMLDVGGDIDNHAGIRAGGVLALSSGGDINNDNLASLSGDSVRLDATGDLNNDGLVAGRVVVADIGGDIHNNAILSGGDYLNISAGGAIINNDEISSDGILAAHAKQDIRNNQALISGRDVSLSTEQGDIVNRTEFRQVEGQVGEHYAFAYTDVGKASTIVSDNSLTLSAGRNVDLQGSQLQAASNINISAGQDVLLGAIEKKSANERYFKGGHNIKRDVTYGVVSLTAGGDLNVAAGRNLRSEAAQFVAAGNASLAAGNDLDLLGVSEMHETSKQTTKKGFAKKTVRLDAKKTVTHIGTTIVAGGHVGLNAAVSDDGARLYQSGDVNMVGVQIAAGGDLLAHAGGEMNIVSGEEWQSEIHKKEKSYFGGLFGSSDTVHSEAQYLGHAELNAGGDMTLLAGNDINVLAGKMNANNISAVAGFGHEAAANADINILGDTETKSLYEEHKRTKLSSALFGVPSLSSDQLVTVAEQEITENALVTTDYIGSQLNAVNDVSLTASRDVNIVGSQVNAGNNIVLTAGRHLNVVAGESSQGISKSHDKGRIGLDASVNDNGVSFFAGLESNKNTKTVDSTHLVASQLNAGGNVIADAGQNINLVASDINAIQSVQLVAGDNVNILSAAELSTLTESNRHLTDGLTVNVNHNVNQTLDAVKGAGSGDNGVSKASSVMKAVDALNNAGPSASAHLGITSTTTTDKRHYVTQRGSTINAGDNIAIIAGGDTNIVGSHLTAGNNLAIKAENIRVDAAYERADTQSEMDRYQAGFNLNASKSNVSITVGGSLAESETGNQSTTAVGSSLSAGNDLSLDAANDIAIIGSDIEAGNDLALLAGDEIFIGAAESTSHQTSDSHSASFGGGLSFGQEGTGIVISAAYGMAEQDREGVSYSNSHLSAGNGLTLRSGGDTTIEGGNLLGNTVDMDIGGDLTLASLQDTGHVDGKRMDVSASVTIGIGFNASAGYGETSGSKAWVNEQSRIIGRESVNVQVDGHTQLTGALIANIDEHGVDQGNLYLDTGSFGYEDLTDHDNEQSDYVSVGFGTSDNPDTAQQESGNSWTIGGEFYERDREQINRATVGQGTLIVGGDRVNLDGLNRDTDIAQEITRDVESETTLYASSTAVDSLTNLAGDPSGQLNQWMANVTSAFTPAGWELLDKDLFNALKGLGQFIANLNKLSPKETAALSDKLGEVQAVADRLLNSDDPEAQKAGKKLAAELERAQEFILLQQAPSSEDDYQVGDAPALPDKSVEELAAEFNFVAGQWNEYYGDVQDSVDLAFATGANRGLFAYLQNESAPTFGSDIDYEGAISFLQSQREAARNNLGLDAGAADGGLFDYVGWTAASVTNESWQALQFIGKLGAYGVTLGSTSSPLDGSSYHSLIGDDTLFGSPQTFIGAVGIEQGVVASYFVGGEGVLFAGVKGIRYLGAAGNAANNSGGTETVQRWMSKAELEATRETGLLRGGRDGTHYVTDWANSDALRARQRSALPQTPEIKVILEVPAGKFSQPSKVEPAFNMPGGGMERTATGDIPVIIKEVQ